MLFRSIEIPCRQAQQWSGQSLPSRGAWIEILALDKVDKVGESLPSRGAWIEICYTYVTAKSRWSLPSRGAWIEIISFHPRSE